MGQINNGTATLQQLMTAAENAWLANNNYLAIPAPTQAQAVAQVTALTRQVNGIIANILTGDALNLAPVYVNS